MMMTTMMMMMTMMTMMTMMMTTMMMMTMTMMMTMMMTTMMMTTMMTMMMIMKSYEHSGEIELAHLKSNCPKSFVQCTKYELVDCRSIDLRERKNQKPISHKPSLTWNSVILG